MACPRARDSKQNQTGDINKAQHIILVYSLFIFFYLLCWYCHDLVHCISWGHF
jgi:hypothetical protein